MHSPMDAGSQSSDSEPEIPNVQDEPRKVSQQPVGDDFPTSIFGGPSKRRGGPSAFMRDVKSRRKEETMARRGGPQGAGEYVPPIMSMGRKDELLEHHIVERLRREFGDPFDDNIFKNAA